MVNINGIFEVQGLSVSVTVAWDVGFCAKLQVS